MLNKVSLPYLLTADKIEIKDKDFVPSTLYPDCVEKIVEVRKEEGLRRYIRMRSRIEGS
jgi:hypothetical protein